MSSEDSVLGRRRREDALQFGPRKKAVVQDPLVHHGRHFGRTVHALCRVHTLLANGVQYEVDLHDNPDQNFSLREQREYRVYRQLLQMVPGLEERLMMPASDDEVRHIADMIQKGSSNARSDDTKSLKGAILDWITPRGGTLSPTLSRNVKHDRGFNHERTGALLCPVDLNWSDEDIKGKLRSGELTTSGDQWPTFLFQGDTYNPQDPWNGLFRNSLLVTAYKHIFTSPSSVDKEPKATRSGNARIYGMISVTLPSLAYVATQVRFALSSSPIFSRTDLTTDSERFYNTILDLFEDPDEKQEVDMLLNWWNRQIFPSFMSTERTSVTETVHAKIKVRRAALQQRHLNGVSGSS
ncbi:hypothetical protein FPV67DRAFT_1417472 [Lyophyllum atratum]|nr:hypothetical protein FPV67DRAFT_1417472 [Lyophyllum atratum]